VSQMSEIQTQHVRFVEIDRPNAVLVVAFLVETRNGETVIVSEPKIVKVTRKKSFALQGSVSCLSLCAPLNFSVKKEHIVASPYISLIFGESNVDFVPGLAAQPPTF